jgi:hypothetical protein
VSLWPSICPVCREELPERGNRRLYVPWKRGFRLVHAGACADAIDAQGVLDLERRQPELVDALTLVRARRSVQRLLDRDQPAEHTREELLAIVRSKVKALLDHHLAGDEGAEQLNRSPEQLRKLVDRVLAHGREVSAPARTDVLA